MAATPERRPKGSRGTTHRRRAAAAAPDERRCFLPTTPEELAARGWAELDVLIVSGDAYVDHPSFGAALIGRCLEARGFRVGLIAQPDWRSTADVSRLGTPRLMVGVTAGNLDSMLAKLTAQKKVRSRDPYSPGGRTGLRPNRATIVYANLCRQAFGSLPIVIGGLEASLRRIAHYDYWSDEVRRSILLDAKADLLVFGMAERAIVEVAERLRAGEPVSRLRDVRGTAWVLRPGSWEQIEPSRRVSDGRPVRLPSFETVKASKPAFAKMTRLFQLESSPYNARPLLQPHGREAVYLSPPALPLSSAELDELYELPFTRRPHFSYTEPIAAYETVKHSVVTNRGCFGGCSFCSLSAHQGRVVQSRSAAGVVREIHRIAELSDYRGTITDLGGPTANMYQLGCKSPQLAPVCRKLSCLFPRICRHLNTDHGPLIHLLRQVRKHAPVEQAYLASGVRHDLASCSPAFIAEIARHHIGGQLSVAPEHSSPAVLRRMHKPPIAAFERFVAELREASRAAGKEPYLSCYFIAGHPGATLADMVSLALYLKAKGIRPRQVQEFIPTPMSPATAMYYTGLDPTDGSPVPCARSLREKRLHKALLLYWDPAHQAEVREALRQAGRRDLIGTAPRCLVPPAGGRAGRPQRSRR